LSALAQARTSTARHSGGSGDRCAHAPGLASSAETASIAAPSLARDILSPLLDLIGDNQ
jgi:hypothetical protein